MLVWLKRRSSSLLTCCEVRCCGHPWRPRSDADDGTTDRHDSPIGCQDPTSPASESGISPANAHRRRGRYVSLSPASPIPNARRKAPLTTNEARKEPGFEIRNAVAIPIPTAESPTGVAQAVPEGQSLDSDIEMGEMGDSDSESEQIPWSSRGQPAIIYPQLPVRLNAAWNERCRRRIEGRNELLNNLFTGVSDTTLQSLEDAERTPGGPKYILAKLQHVAHGVHKQQTNRGIMGDYMDQEGEVERQDGSGEEDSQDLLECVRRVMIVEATIPRSLNSKSQAGKTPPGGRLHTRGVPGKEVSPDNWSDFEGEPVPVASDEEEEKGSKQGEKEDAGNVLSQCCNDMAC